MSPARQHRDRFAATKAAGDPSQTADSSGEGGQQAPAPDSPTPNGPVSPARRHTMRHAALSAGSIAVLADTAVKLHDALSALAAQGDDAATQPPVDQEPSEPPAPPVDDSATPAERTVRLRLIEDLRRLKDIRSIQLKIEAKRQMLPDYVPWIDGVLQAAAEGRIVTNEVAPTIMVWRMDVGDYVGALPLIDFVLLHKVPLPPRYERDAATLIVEEIANAAIKAQGLGERFNLAILEHVEALTAAADIHDQVRAKLAKAIGEELLATASTIEPGAEGFGAAYEAALAPLRRAQALNDRVGVKDRIKRAEKALAALAPQNEDTAGNG